jgi:glycerol-3-phosphate acyltransferase PlsY
MCRDLCLASIRPEVAKLFTVQDLALLMMVEYGALSSALANIITALELFLTLHVTVATVDRSIFIIYLRSTVGQRHQSELAWLRNEAESAREMNTDSL